MIFLFSERTRQELELRVELETRGADDLVPKKYERFSSDLKKLSKYVKNAR